MNWPPIAIRQESRVGLNEPAPEVLQACWGYQVVGLIFPPVSNLFGALLQFVTPDDSITRQIAVTVELCELVGDLPSMWVPVDSKFLGYANVLPGSQVGMDLPVNPVMSAGAWGVRLKSTEPRATNLKMMRDSVGIDLTFGEPSPEPVGGPYGDILSGFASAVDRISVMVHGAGEQRRVLLDVDEELGSWAALVIYGDRPLVTYRGELE